MCSRHIHLEEYPAIDSDYIEEIIFPFLGMPWKVPGKAVSQCCHAHPAVPIISTVGMERKIDNIGRFFVGFCP